MLYIKSNETKNSLGKGEETEKKQGVEKKEG